MSNKVPDRPPADAIVTDAAKRFIASMTMTFDMWHDGTGYDLAAIDEFSAADRDAVAAILLAHMPQDWRDIEALACIDTDAAKKGVVAALKSADPKIRREAMQHAGDQADSSEREKLLITSIGSENLYGGLTAAIDEATEFHPPAVVDALFMAALNRNGEAAVHFAALLFYIHGKAKEPFDWTYRPLFLRFNTTDAGERKAAFMELCEKLGVDARKYLGVSQSS